MSRKKELVKNTAILFIGKLFTQMVSFLLLPLYTAYLTTAQYGTVDLIITYIYLLSPMVTLQLEKAVFRYLIEAKDDDSNRKKVINISLKIILFILTIFIFITFLVTRFIEIKYVYLILINVITCIFINYLLQIARGFGKAKHYTIASSIAGITTIILNILFIVVIDFKIEGMLIAISIANLLASVYLCITLKIFKYIDLKVTDNKLLKSMLNYSLPLIPNDIFWWIINVSDRTIITMVLGVAVNGIYTVSNKFSTLFIGLFNIFGLSWTESAARHIDDKDRDKYFSEVINTAIKIFSSIAIGIIVTLPLVFNLLVSDSYTESYKYIPILMLASLINAVVGLYSAIYIAKKLTKQVMYTSIMAAVINIMINIIFIKHLGLYIAAFSTLASYIFMMVYRNYDLKKYVNIKYDKKVIFYIAILLIISFITYYINNLYLNIIGLFVMIIATSILNKKEIILVYTKLKKSLI